ncbi:hypothetical protein ONZ43_g2317 [Nemania bipapillata]|uniref:Uncharacterized protein n=1 Tax=Nemania bipapillata TaxID=110536 RepID=A0ACC2J1B5_9PEZI|nr:hypothetical protein ONZ43_g2317 [Nemania bipapillata]
MKFNLKLGGRNHVLDTLKLGVVGQKKTMVVGIDVTHPAPGSLSKVPSVAGIVASVDECLGQWPAEIRIQAAGQEMVADLEDMFKSRLRLWETGNNKTLPENILVYRDGVSEGQYDDVVRQELSALRNACMKKYPAPATKAGKPHITIVIVGKRHNTRFFPTKQEDADDRGNPKNGTVVDRGITEARNWDFFLQSHTAVQGTARPAHYYVVYDQIFKNTKTARGLEPAADALENLTHNMCYLFGRATKAVSICPPVYYAHLVCARARCYLQHLPDFLSPPKTDAKSVGAIITGVKPDDKPDSKRLEIYSTVRDKMFYI